MLRSRPSFSSIRRASTTRQVVKAPLPSTAYQPTLVENKYQEWKERGLFRADQTGGEKFSMVLPPPNVTGKLHLGHALACTIQDVIVRRQRSLGKNVLWVPGVDHAGIATQGVVEKHLKSKHNVDRHSIGRDKFNLEVWKWKEQHGNIICDQLRKLGASLDWSKFVFTMDPTQVEAVNEAFIRLFEKGLIYRKKALVNWCIELRSTISDIEVDNFEVFTPVKIALPGYKRPVEFGHMTEFAYKVCDSDEEVVVATTRLETMLGDTAVAVHPDDNRYKHLHNRRLHHPFREETIPIIADPFVDVQFGTGAVKVTPAHDKTDYEVGDRHKLQIVEVINEDGVMNENAGEFKDLKRYDCREALRIKLDDLGVLKRVVPHKMSLPRCSRTGDVIEILPKEQWFISCKELNEKAVDMVRNGNLKIQPENFVKNWNTWTSDQRDWCVSRQLWWGHQIPAYECCNGVNKVWVAAMSEEDAKKKAAKMLDVSENDLTVKRDTDVLDTWFSSGIYPFSSLGWPKKSKDYENYYPLSLMATGHDILGFWVHRMVILGLELTGKLPFNEILLHGIICDSKGAKMSKSRGNVIDPIDVIRGITLEELNARSEEMFKTGILNKEELHRTKAYNKSHFPNGIPECGVDGLRFTLLTNDIKSHFVHFDVDVCHANKLFCNKIWQSIKYTQMSFDKLKQYENVTQSDLSKLDLWILSRLANMVEIVNNSIESYDFHIATTTLKTLIYSEFCDIYLETTKPGFDSDNLNKAYAHAHTLSAVLNTALRCLSPFMVYVTHELIPKIPAFETNIIHNFEDNNDHFIFPEHKDFVSWRNVNLEDEIKHLNDAISLVRQLRGLYAIPNRIKPRVHIKSKNNTISSVINDNSVIFMTLTRCSEISLTDDIDDGHVVTAIMNNDCTVNLLLENTEENSNLILSAKNKISKRTQKIEENISKIENKMANSKYCVSAPESVQIADKEKLKKMNFELCELRRLSS